MNKAAEAVTGYAVEEALGKKAGSKKLWGGRMTKEFYEKLWKTIKEEKAVFIGEISNVRKDGEAYDAASSISPVLGQDGTVRFFVGIERDITKEKQIDRAKTEFVSLASHQLRTPLTAIKWNAEIVLEEELSADVKSYIDQIYQSNERMIELVNGLLNVSRIDMGTFAIEPEKIDPIVIFDSVLGELEPLIVSKKLKITKTYKTVDAFLNTDKKLLRIVVQNLLSNAVKYTDEKGKVEVSVKKTKTNFEFIVQDSGMGIPKNQQGKIFSKLFRAENAVASVADGTGLGLYVTKAVVEQLGGKITFKSTENKGTTFFFNLPIDGIVKKEGNKELTST
jgi:PAS domain S-box-containing protein